MSSFNLVLDSTSAMLIELARAGVTRTTAFEVIDRVNLMNDVIVTPTIDALPPVRVTIHSGRVIVTASHSMNPDTESCWIRVYGEDLYVESHGEALAILHEYESDLDECESQWA
jgi:hypothetical protein